MKNEIIKSHTAFIEIISVGNSIFNTLDFPEIIFKKKDWNLYFLESWNIFDKYSYNQFISFCEELNEKEFYVCAISIMDYNFDDYIKTINNQNKSYYPLLKITVDMPFEKFDELQESYNFTSATNSFIFSKSRKWGLYVNTNIDLMILGYCKDIKNIAYKRYFNNKERIRTIDVLYNELDSWAKKENLAAYKKKIFENYNNHF